MSPRTAGRLALILGAVGVLVWFAMPDELWPQRAVIVLTIEFVAVTCFDRARFPGAARTETTMGPAGDVLIGFPARVVSLTPLRVEALGAIWSARLLGAPAVSQQALVDVVGREGLTLLVRPTDEARDSAGPSRIDCAAQVADLK